MRMNRRSAIATGVFVLLGAIVVLGRWYESRSALSHPSSGNADLDVTNGADRGPGTLREALFIAAAAGGRATISIKVPKISVETPLPPLVNPHGVSVAAPAPGAEVDAHALSGGPVFDVSGPDTTIEGLHVVSCPAAGVLLRAVRFHLKSALIENCDVGVDVAEGVRVGVRVGVAVFVGLAVEVGLKVRVGEEVKVAVGVGAAVQVVTTALSRVNK